VRVLVINAGSSSLKLTLLGGEDETIASSELSVTRSRFDLDELSEALRSGLGDADAVGHRIVHGGERYHEAVRIDARVEHDLRELTALAPLHQPKSLQALEAVSERLPDLPAVACFDTAFHTTLAPAASTYALPADWRERLHLRRYGFHGLSHAWVARRAPELLGHAPEGLRIISCHLGAGASLCAIRDGVSVDTTMGFTPLEGLVMATRSGTVDPGLLLWLAEHERMQPAELAQALEHESGLLGLSGSADMREILTRGERGEDQAELALEVYIHRLQGLIGAMAAAIGGVDALVFTGGVGEHAPAVRARACAGLGFLGVALDEARNLAAEGDAEIGAGEAAARTLVLTAREDREIARQTRAVLA
jgi:acetate kinase